MLKEGKKIFSVGREINGFQAKIDFLSAHTVGFDLLGLNFLNL
jgi:hypothetical protein